MMFGVLLRGLAGSLTRLTDDDLPLHFIASYRARNKDNWLLLSGRGIPCVMRTHRERRMEDVEVELQIFPSYDMTLRTVVSSTFDRFCLPRTKGTLVLNLIGG